MKIHFFFLFIKLIGVTLGWQVSGVQLYNIPYVYYIMCLPPQVESPSITFNPHYTLFNLQEYKLRKYNPG